jgi:YHS domain-containing protein
MTMKRVLGVALFGCLVACGGNAADRPPPATPEAPSAQAGEHHGQSATPGAPVKAPGEANVGDTTKCPVSGEEFVVEANSPKAEYKGKTYYFCCPGCDKKFESNPEKFLNKS